MMNDFCVESIRLSSIAAIGSVLLCLTLAPGPAIADQGSAFYEGKSFAGPKVQGHHDSVKSGAFGTPLTGYNSMYPSETEHYGDGNGLVREAGSSKLQNCSSYVPGGNAVANQECEAVNFLARNPDVRAHFNLGKSDPMITKARSIRDNADAIFKTLGINWADGGGNNCTTTTVTAPALYTTEICSTMRDLGEEQCTMGRKIEIDTDSRFQCKQTINAYEFPKCRRKFLADAAFVFESITLHGGGENSEYVMNTWTEQHPVRIVENATLTYWQADNWGQLWINDQLALDDTYNPHIDYRGGSIVREPNYIDDEIMGYQYVVRKNGVLLSIAPPDVTSSRFVGQSMDMTRFFNQNASNKVDIVCGNTRHIGPCYYTITLNIRKPVINGGSIQSDCAELEARSR